MARKQRTLSPNRRRTGARVPTPRDFEDTMEHKKSKARNGLRGLLYWSLVGVALAVSMFSFHPSHSSAIQQCGTHLLQAIAVGSFAGIDCTGANRPSPSRASPLCSDDEPPVGPPP